MTVSHHQREYPVAEQIPGGDERGIPRRDADGRPADEPLDRHADETGRNGNDRAEHRDDAAERKSASMLRVDEFMAFLYERAEFSALSEKGKKYFNLEAYAHELEEKDVMPSATTVCSNFDRWYCLWQK